MEINSRPENTITIAQAGLRLGLSYQQVLRLVMVGEIRGWQNAQGRWEVDAQTVAEAARPRTGRRVAGREEPK